MTIEASAAATTRGGITYGMVGGGRGAFIGSVHRKAIAMDDLADLAAGCFSTDYENTVETFIGAVAKRKAGQALTAADLDFPNVADGIRGVRFIEACVASSKKGAAWVRL